MSDVPRSLQSWVSTIQTVVLTADVFCTTQLAKLSFNHSNGRTHSWRILKLKYVSCEYDRLNGWNSTLQAAWYIRHVRIIWYLWAKRTIWLLILSFTQDIVRACSMFYPYEGYRSVTPLDAARVNRTIFHDHSVHWYYITLMKGRYYIKHDMNVRHGKQNPRRERWL